ncbi:fungal-specific transcription factor domain-containing protein [Abortiporus biennis]|nr:fungal-specific transcription factor domain-containing protein [Abortiporus biennis]
MVKPSSSSTPDGTPAPMSTLRRKADEDVQNTRASKKPRTRVSYSCGECHRRKQKCDRQIPCSHCVARKVPELCKAYTPGKNDQDLHMRLSRLEQIVEAALPQYWSSGSISATPDPNGSMERHRSTTPGADDDNRSQPEDEEPNTGIFDGGRWYGANASSSIAAPAVLQKLQNMVEASTSKEGSRARSLSVDQLPSDIFHSEPKRVLVPAAEPSPADKLKSFMQDCGVAPHKISELIQELPPRSLSDRLIDYYFSAVNWTRYPIYERDFRSSYAAIHAEGTAVNPNDVRFLPLLFVVLAISARLAPEHIAGDHRTRRLTSSRYYWSSRRSLLIAAAVQPDCLEMVLTRMLSARFLILDRKMTECWSQLGAAVRTAQAIGLHRDSAALRMDPFQVEYRRRIWSYLYHSDRAYALVLGRPSAINDEYTSTPPPMNIEDENLLQLRNPLPLTTPTQMTYTVLRHYLSAIMGRMVHQFQKVHSPVHYQDILAIDDELVKFINTLPPHYALEPDTSLDQAFPYIPAHRFLLVTEALFVRITLHRPYLLRRLSSERYLRSRNACFECAMKDFRIRRQFISSAAKDVRDPVASSSREFLSAMISGIYLVLHPQGKDAQNMSIIADTFVKEHEGKSDLDETTRREVKIIEFLKNRSSQQASPEQQTAPSLPHDMPQKPHTDAQLLLGLHRSSPRSSAMVPRIPSSPLSQMAMGGPMPSTPTQFPNTATTFTQAVPGAGLSAVQQLQQAESSSQSGSGSPINDDESTAQSLLDQWCNVFSGGPTVDGTANGPGLPWATPGISDLTGWLHGGTSPLLGNEPNPIPDVDGSDWSYWETLVNQIRSGPVA